MLRNVSLNLLTSKTIYLTIISLIFFSGNSCFSTEEFTLKEQEVSENHRNLKKTVESFYVRIGEKSFFKPPSRFQKSFDIKKAVNLCSIGIQCIFSSAGKVQATPFQIVSDSQRRPIVASSSSADQWKIDVQEDNAFHLLAWPTQSRQSLFLTVDLLKKRAFDNFLFGLDLSKITTNTDYTEVLVEMKRFFTTIQEVIKKIKPGNTSSISTLDANELESLEKLNKLIEASTFPDLKVNTSQLDLDKWKAFLESGYLKPEHAQRKIFIEYILSEDMKTQLKEKLVLPEIKKYSHFLGVSLEEYMAFHSNAPNPLSNIRFNSNDEEHSEPLLSAWIQRNRKDFEASILSSYLSADPQLKPLYSVYFLYTCRSTCKNCEEISHTLISKAPLLISFSEVFKKNGVDKFSDIAGLSLNLHCLERLSTQNNPTNIDDWKGIVRIPVQYNIGE